MWDRFTEDAKSVMAGAREEAAGRGSECVLPEHILLALCRVKDGVAATVLRWLCREPEGTGARLLENLGIDVGLIAAEIDLRITRSEPVKTEKEIAFAPRAKKIVELAAEEARGLNHSYIGTEHILLGLLKEAAGELLNDYEADLAGVETEVIRVLDEQSVTSGTQASPRVSRRTVGALVRATLLETCTRDLTQLSKDGQLSPLYSRA